MKELIIVGGPNGSGKSTFAGVFLTEFNYPFLNSDDLRKGLDIPNDGIAQITAGRMFLKQLHFHRESGNSLILESTLSGLTLLAEIRKFILLGYSVKIFFVYLESTDQHLKRIRQRVVKGGHSVPELDVLRRFKRSHHNFWNRYKELAEVWTLINNASNKPQPVAHRGLDEVEIFDVDLYNDFLKILES
jgi:predicted ABC-type ATPase